VGRESSNRGNLAALNAVGLLLHQTSTLRIIDRVRDGTVADPLDRFINHMKRNQEPLLWAHRMSETIMNDQIELCRREDAVKEVFQLRAIDFSQLVARDHFNVCQQICGS